MQISRFTDYALRTLIHLAIERERLTAVAEIAGRYGVSRNHMLKVVGRLQELGHVATYRGRNGGIALAREPDRIRVGALVAALENLALVECLEDGGACAIDGACRLRHALVAARTAFLAELDRHTLADLVEPRSRLRAALALA